MSTVLQLATATAAKSGSTVTATIGTITTTVQVARDLTVAAGDVLVVAKVGSGSRAQWFALGRGYTAAPAAVQPTEGPPPVYGVASGRLTVLPTFTGTYRDGAWLTGVDEPAQGAYGGAGNATGVAYYGYKPQSISGATVTGARVALRRGPGGTASAQTATLQQVAGVLFDGSAPSLLDDITGPALAIGDSTVFAVPTAWAQDFVDGNAGGLGVFDADGSPYMRFTGRAASASAWLLTIDWQR